MPRQCLSAGHEPKTTISGFIASVCVLLKYHRSLLRIYRGYMVEVVRFFRVWAGPQIGYSLVRESGREIHTPRHCLI